MDIRNKLLSFAGKTDFELDERIPTSYVFSQCWKYGWMLIRGIFFSVGDSNVHGRLFKGRNVKIIQKKKLVTGNGCRFHDNVYIDALSQEGVILGDGVLLGRNTRIECTGSLNFVGKGVKIGSGSTFGSDCFFGAAGGIEIGENVVAGQQIRFHSENHNFDDLNVLIKNQGVCHKGIKIGNNCWIGAGVVFLDGAELADGCVVAANAVVTKKFQVNSVIGGIPARVIKTR